MEQGCVCAPRAGRKSVDQADASSEHLALEAFIALPSRKWIEGPTFYIICPKRGQFFGIMVALTFWEGKQL